MKNSALIAQYIYDGEDLGHPYIQSTTVLCDRATHWVTCLETYYDVRVFNPHAATNQPTPTATVILPPSRDVEEKCL